MRRHELDEKQFKKREKLLPGRKDSVGVTAKNNRNFINAIYWIFKTGAPWRDLPERYGVGKMFIADFLAGQKQGCSIEFFECYRKMLTWNF